MDRNTIPGEEQALRRSRLRRIWQRIVGGLACVVVFITTYALILPAITMEKETVCGFAEHIHGEMCFDAEQVMLCTLPEHTHTDTCREILETTASTEMTEEAAAMEELLETVPQEPTAPVIIVEGEGMAPVLAPIPEVIIEEGYLANAAGEADAIHWKVVEEDDGMWTLRVDGYGDIPDFSSYSDNLPPWSQSYRNNNKIKRVIVGDEITCIGNSSFSGFKMVEATIGKAVRSIGVTSFYQCYSLKSITIPGSVEVIKSSAFYNNYALNHVEIENGVKRIEQWAFLVNNVTSVYIPESVEYISGSAFTDLEEYIVSEKSPYFKAIDGVLYSYDLKTLVDYPSARHAAEYVTPDHIDTVQAYALCNVKNTPKLRVTSNVKNLPSSNQFGVLRSGLSHNWEEIYIEDGVPIALKDSFYSNHKLKYVRLPESPEITTVVYPFHGCSALESVTLPKSITKIAQFYYGTSSTIIPPHVVYDIVECEYPNKTIFSSNKSTFALEIGPNVDALNGKFNEFVEHSSNIKFHGENWFTVAEGMFASAKSPLNTLQGNVYVDTQGVVYAYDPEAGTAAVVYVQPGVQSVTIPRSIFTEDGQTECVITTVKQNALVDADGMTTLTFDAAEFITTIEALAMANCTTLVNVNGQTTVEGAEASFPNENLTMGYDPFYNTGLTGASGGGAFDAEMDGEKALTVTRTDIEDMVTDMDIVLGSEGGTMTWEEQEDGSGGYHLLTNDTLNIIGIAGDPEGNKKYVYRIYLRTAGQGCVLSITPGNTYEFDGTQAVCQQTEDPYTIYLEFNPEIGTTVNVPVTAVYPSPKSPGGGLTIWGTILTENEATAQAGHLIESEQTIQALWTVQPDTFDLTKKAAGGNVSIVGYTEETTNEDGETVKEVHARPDNSLQWQIVLKRASDTSSAYGKDYIKSVDFTDTITFPEGVSWRQEVLDAVKAGDTSGGYAGDIQVASISQGTGLRLSWDKENQKILIHWRAVNSSGTAELGSQTIDLNILPQAVEVGMNKLGTTMTITNQAEAVVHYHHSADVPLRSETATKTISGGQASMQTKITASGGNYFGEDVTYTTTVYNNGASPWMGNAGTVYHARFEGSQNVWITPENMERMFGDHPELTVEITGAALGTCTPVTGTDGVENSARVHPGNSNVGTDGHSLIITKTDTVYRVTADESKIWENTSLEAALQEAGYAVTREARYFCTWPLNGEEEQLILNSGQERVFKTYATYKNTFQILKTDLNSQYGSKKVSVTSEARVLEQGGKVSATTNVYRDAVIGKSTRRNGQYLSEMDNFSDGDVLEYHLDFTHYGTGAYEDLPMVDEIYGSQYLLVQKALNPGLAGLREHEGYYVLTPGTYQNVVVGVDDEGTPLTAASITVTAKENDSVTVDGVEQTYTGLYTIIKWYFPDRKAEEYLLTVTYQTLVDFSAGEVTYTIGNVIWMNDHTGSRLYASGGWGGGTLLTFDKDIVLEDGTLAKYSPVGEGAQVTYRLALENTQNRAFALAGSRFADALPLSVGGVNWEKDVNITDFRYETQGNVTVSGLENWYIGTEFGALLDDSRQYILWSDDTSIQWTGEGVVYLYFTLTYPQNAEGTSAWTDYVNAVGGEKIDNTFYIYRSSAEVTHDLLTSGEVLLQKGVFGMYHYANSGNVSYIKAGNSRYYYNNNDSRLRAVLYYVSIYNDSGKRLYLTELQDKLPDGFTFLQMMADSNVESVAPTTKIPTITTRGGYNAFGNYSLVDLGRDGILYRSASVSASVDDNGLLHFAIGAGKGDYSILFDAERQEYYLNAGEALAFGYTCNTGLTADSDDHATNVIGLPYIDHLDTGVSVLSREEMQVNASNSGIFTDFNDGNRLVKTSGQVSQQYGFSGHTGEWLVSEVTVHRGGIVPGVTKDTVSFYDPDTKLTQTYKTSVRPNHTVNWRVTLHNSGTLALTDYTITDIMPAPYVFVGDVKAVIKDARGSKMTDEILLLTFQERRENEVDITSYGFGASISMDGSRHRISTRMALDMSMQQDGAGNEVLTLNCQDSALSIPEGGSIEITFSSRNPTNSYENQVYTNQAKLIPNAQSFDHIGQGSMIRDEDGTPLGAINFSPVTVSFGFTTTSEKKAAYRDDTGNVVDSSVSGENLRLPDLGTEFDYTLTVENSTDTPMTKLVLIDSLPQPGDCSPFDSSVARNSQFTVNLLSRPVITIVSEEGESMPLDDEQYFWVEYSTGKDFGGPQSADWKGLSVGTTADWTATLENARAFRIVIKDDAGEMIPAKSKVSVSFKASAADDASYGETATNSFGYHYELKGVSSELEAMPLGVGVTMPYVPTLEKRLVDAQGVAADADEAASFTFRITRELLEGENQASSITVNAVVPAKQSASGQITLEAPDGFWHKDLRYTVTEETKDEAYTFRQFHGSTTAEYSFVYDPTVSQRIICENAVKNWSAELIKTDAATGNPLDGAVFGIYSTDAREMLNPVPEAYKDAAWLNQNGKDWYLKEIGTTGENGCLSFGDLSQKVYYLVELKAPDGYQLPKIGWHLDQAESENSVFSLTVKNSATYELPETGGAGTGWFLLSGTVAIMMSAYLYFLERRRKGYN